MPVMEIVISLQGEARLQTIGFAGSACRIASQRLEQSLGLVASEQLTTEFHQTKVAETGTTSQNGSEFSHPHSKETSC